MPGDVSTAHSTAVTMGSTNPFLGAPTAQEQREARFFNVFKYRNSAGFGRRQRAGHARAKPRLPDADRAAHLE